MKSKLILPLGLILSALPCSAQDIYKMEQMSSSDLIGTARYVSMGGAMNALGADLSTMGTNPAAIGLYRRGDIAMTGSLLMQPDAEDLLDIRKNRLSFDQMGFVYAAKMGGDLKFINFGFNYHKSKNAKNFIGVSNFETGGASQTWQFTDLCNVNGWLDLSAGSKDRDYTTPLTLLAYDTELIVPTYDNEDKINGYLGYNAEAYNYRKVQWGSVQDYDFNLSMNWNDQVYGGLTFGVKNVNLHSGTHYSELLVGADDIKRVYNLYNEEEISGNGYDVKFGLIIRPIETSPFRIGFSVHTPTFYELKTNAYLGMETPVGADDEYIKGEFPVETNEYKIRTPWKLNLSMATTVENILALDAEYEFSDYGSSKVSYFSNDYYEESFFSGENDRYLNNEAKKYLKPVHSFRFGAEARLNANFYLRGGYNYVSAPFKKEAYLNLFTNSSSYYYNANTDYLNLGETQRATCGLGFKSGKFYADIAYMYQKQMGDLYTFHVQDDNGNNLLEAAKVDLVKHNLMLTIGYKF